MRSPDHWLKEAAKSGDAGEVVAALRAGADPEAALELAAQYAPVAAFEPLLPRARSLGAALREACTSREGAPEKVEMLLTSGITPHDLGEALLLVTELGRDDQALRIARLLLDAGADPNARRSDAIPLLSAVARRDEDLARELLARGANPDAALQEDSETFELPRGLTPRRAAQGTGLEALFVA